MSPKGCTTCACDLTAHAGDEHDSLAVETLRERVPEGREGTRAVKVIRQKRAQVGHESRNKAAPHAVLDGLTDLDKLPRGVLLHAHACS